MTTEYKTGNADDGKVRLYIREPNEAEFFPSHIVLDEKAAENVGNRILGNIIESYQ